MTSGITTTRETATGTMKAIVQEGSGSADVLHVREIERPAVTEGRLLLRVRAASVNALDWHSVHGGAILEIASKIMRSKDIPVRGVDVAGVVEAVGAGVTGFSPGDEVFGGAPASFAEYASAREDAVVQKPKGVSFEQGAAVGVAGRTALQGLRDHGHVKAKDRVLIFGAGGGVGTFAVQIGKALGAHVTAVTGSRNVDVIRSLGADEVIDYQQEDVTRRSQKYDAILDVAATRPLGRLLRVLAPGGTLVMVGAAKGGTMGIFTRIAAAMVRSRIRKQRVVFFVAKSTLDDLIVLKDWLEAGKVRAVIDRTYPLSEAAEAVRYVGTGQARAKVVITMG
ncbi:MAG: NAD(P)-dependent alcohol dehydrogenase [Chloroflexota bacterium]|nr:NAD(P)-dependent alcohol dehydrogenase [Chloroflexota bacterium]